MTRRSESDGAGRLLGLAVRDRQGAEATFLVLDGDPRRDAGTLLAPRAVWLRSRRVR